VMLLCQVIIIDLLLVVQAILLHVPLAGQTIGGPGGDRNIAAQAGLGPVSGMIGAGVRLANRF